ncbi:dimodular nonribosomal peptide synthase [Paenibacillus marchantiophytorum]|uniref:Dimodular nonribosomal peptide synthase n=1 Tax=Paenibacillus marchantiophytorum TaxID=1619310 RepID=A0ABQ1FJ10_9BACL|nr:non-ribosomal peptide synthetase [Paenibacillus marchantiophytorum]GGA16336.1 dimodular nonribosomal peptide synthase [Paenibacillus marchantiophytorum]
MLVAQHIRRPLSGAQSGIWYAQQLDPDNPMYNTGEWVEIHGLIDPIQFEKAVRQVVLEAQTLHVKFAEDGDGPWQAEQPDSLWPFTYLDLTAETEPDLTAKAWMDADLRQPCDLTQGPLFTEVLFRVGQDRFLWYQRIHHIVMDGFGFSLLSKRVAKVYTALMNHLPVQEGSFGSWQRVLEEDQAYRTSAKAQQDRQFWLERFADEPDAVSLAEKSPRSAKSFLRQTTLLSPSQAQSLRACAQLHEAAWSDLVLAAAGSYLHRLTGASEVILGLPMMGRLGSVSLNTPAMVMNILPLRLFIRPGMSVSELVQQIAREIREIRKHQGYRHEELRRDLKRVGDNRRIFGPLINIMPFDNNLNFDGHEGTKTNLSAGPVDDLAINVYLKADGSGLQIDMDGNPELYTAAELEAHHQRFVHYLGKLTEAYPSSSIGLVELLADSEREGLLTQWNDTFRPLPSARTSELFEAQATRSPAAEAVVHNGVSVSYEQLNAKANQLARLLIAHGAGPQSIVALALPRSVEMIVSMLAVHKTGAAYLPLDPDYPADRVAYMLEDARALVTLTSQEVASRLTEDSASKSIVLDDHETSEQISRLSDANISDQERIGVPAGQNPAYILYTSGSTGRPKGVVISFASLTNFLLSMQEQFSLGAADRLFAVTTVAFDISILEIFLPLLNGAQVIVADKITIQDSAALSKLIVSSGATLMQATPSLWHALVEHEPHSLRGLRVLVGGEALSAGLLRDLLQLGCQVTNLYGPTETTIWSTALTFTSEPDGKPSIGRPIWNTQLYILDSALQPVPLGVTGDLYIAGDGLAVGYLGRAALTAERFVANPHGLPGSRMYRTGDLARWLPDGTLDYSGRADHQIKIRGFRIEVAEIEAVLAEYPGVLKAAVVVREDQPGDKRLVAYAVASEAVETGGLRDFAAVRLPDYMIPSAFVFLDELPLTPNGKLDRKALPAPHYSQAAIGRAARTPQEEILSELFAEVLGVPRIGIDDEFFDLGGHSLLAGRLMNRIREVMGVELGIASLFEAPTVAGMAKRLDHAAAARPAIRPAVRPQDIPLSFAQRRLWFLNCLEGPSPTYNIPLVIHLKGHLNREALEAALADLVERHETLRTIFPENGGVSKQLILEASACPTVLHTAEIIESELACELALAVRYGFDLAQEQAFRAHLYQVGPQGDTHVLLLLLHHIVGDGWSLAPLTRDLAAAYGARSKGEAPILGPLPLQYADYALWQEQLLGDESHADSLIARQVAYWRSALHNLPDQLELPTDYPRPAEATHMGDTLFVHLNANLHGRLVALARESRTSLFMVIQSGLAALLTRLGAGTDIPLGSPIAGRSDDALGELVGLFINTLILRTDTSGDPTFRELLGRVRSVNLAAYEHQDVPFERLVEVLNPPRSRARHPLFQIMLAFQNTPEASLDFPELTSELHLETVGKAKFDLTIEFRERRGEDGSPAGIDGWFEYTSDLYERETVEKLAARLFLLLERALEEPDVPIGILDILMPEERQSRIVNWEQPAAASDATIVELFEARVREHPDAVAVVYEGESLSYAELNAQANQWAHLLIAQGVGPEMMVGLMLPRSTMMMVGILAVLKAGAGYLPLDPDYPADRLAFMLEDTGPACLIGCKQTASMTASAHGIPAIILDDPQTLEKASQYSAANPADDDRKAPLSPDNVAYIIYTSGSTGKPKGVVIPHANVVRLFSSTAHWFDFGREDAWTLFHSYAFDFSVWEMWGALLYGGRLVVVPHTVSRSPEEFLKLLCEENVTVLNQTPSAFYQLMQADREYPELGQQLSLRYVIFGGEALDLGQLEDWYERHEEDAPRLINMYGITETTVHVSYKALSQEMAISKASSLIGVAIPDLQVYVLDAYFQHVPPGVTGEMYVAGAGLARGYWKRPGLTSERFIADPYGVPGSRMYRTGDLAKWRNDGTLDYIGRIDHQVKIRGFRIELGEIEAVIAQYPGVAQAIVIAREDTPGDKRLVGYLIPALKSEIGMDLAAVRQHIAAALPGYMVPSALVEIPELPLTVNGKMDRKALPAPDFSQAASGRGPRTPQEEILCDLYAETLGLPKVGIDDGFFDLGGHSLLAVKLMSRIREALGASLSIGTLFEAPTVAELAEKLETGGSQGALEVLLPLRTSGKRPPLFCIHPAGGLSWCYAGLMKSLGPDYPLYGLQARGIARPEALPVQLEDMAADYIAHLRSVQPHGPYYLLGWSLGGNVAHAIASQLQQAGEEIALLVMLDAFPSHFLPLRDEVDEHEALIALLALGGYDPDSLGDKPLDMAAAVDILRSDGSALASLEPSVIMSLKETYVNSVRILGAFRPVSFTGDLLFFHSTVIPDWFTPISPDTWKSHIVGDIEQYDLACRHKDLCQPGPLAEIGRILAEKLAAMHAE